MRSLHISFWILLGFTLRGGAVEFSSSTLPIVFIDTHGERIRNSVRIPADMGIIDNPGQRNHIEDHHNNYDGKIAIEIRGSSGQWQKWPKQQFGFETQTDFGENNNVSLVGMPAENDWILYPPYSDKSLLRNVLAYRLSNDIGCYAPRTHFCELVLNGDYQGVYVLMEKIKRDKNRLDIATLRPEDLAGDQLTGGYVIKIDRRAGEENAGWISPFRKWAKGDVEWLYHDPGHDELKDEQKSYIKDYILRFEVLMDKPDWQKSYEQFLNVETFIDYYVLTELALNIDTYTFSTFFYKDRDSKGGKLCFGPVWDFNLAYGNADYFIGMQTEGWLLGTKIQEKDRISFWLKNLYDSRDIQSRITERWKTLREKELALPRILALVDAWVDTLAEAQVRNFERWPILGEYIWPNYYIGNSYEDEILYLKTWITKRWTWIDQQLQSNIQIVDPREKPAFHLQQNYPNPFNQSTRFVYELERDDFVEFIIYNSLGQPVRKLVSALQNRGQHVVQWDGCNEHKIQAPAGLYFAVLSNDESTHMIKMLLLP